MTTTTYPWKKQDKFARVNEDYEQGLGGLTPCAKLLHRWLVRMAKPLALFEINLLNFQNNSQNYRGNKKGGFCFRWIKQAFDQLVEIGLVLVEHRYNKQEFKIKVRRPNDAYFSSPVTFPELICPSEHEVIKQYIEELSNTNDLINYNTDLINKAEALKKVYSENENFSSENENESSKNGNKNSQKEGSNDANSYSYHRYIKITTDTEDPPSNHPVVVSSNNSFNNNEIKTATPDNSNQAEPVNTNVPSRSQMKKLKNTLDEINKPSVKVKTPEIPDDFIKECQDTKIYLHPQLIKKMREFTMRVLKNALAVVKEQMNANREVRNPTGLFVQAMTNEWKPSTIKQDSEMRYGIEFHNWYQKAVEAGVVEDLPIKYLSVMGNTPMVRIPKPEGSYPPYETMKWTEARNLFGDFDDCNT